MIWWRVQVESISAMRSPIHAAKVPEWTSTSTSSPVSRSTIRTDSVLSPPRVGGVPRRASIESVVNPTAAASVAHRSRSDSGSMSTLLVRVASMASAAAAAPSTPSAAIAASISARRLEKTAMSSAGTPATSAKAVTGWAPRHAESFGELVLEGGAEHGAGGVLGSVEALGVER